MTLGERLRESAEQYGDKAALVFRDAPMSYSALWQAVQATAAGMAALGIGSGDKIGLLLPNCPPFVMGVYGAALLGAVAVPVNPLLKPAELEYIWRDAGVKLVIAAGALLPNVVAARQNLPELSHIISITPKSDLDASLAGMSGLLEFGELHLTPQPPLLAIRSSLGEGESQFDAPLSSERSEGTRRGAGGEGDPAVIIYTSGTTGHPKGAMLSHHNLLSNVAQIQQVLKFEPSDVLMTTLPLFHSFAGTVCMHLVLATGGSAVLMENFVPGKVMETLEKEKVTIFPAVPAMLNALLNLKTEREYDLSTLRYFVSGGAPLPAATLDAVEKRFGVPVLEGDGPTECSPVTCVNPPDGVRKVSSVGPALPGVEVAIFDDKDNPLPRDTVGEIVVRGDNVMLGYYNQPEATAEAMTGGWYHTGDLGTIDADGYIFIVDRKKDMIITGGLNVYPREIEEVLYTHPAILDAAVIGMPDALRGEDVLAVIVKKPNAEVTEREIVVYCRERLANYKVPRKVLFRETLPRGGTGKVVKRLLKKELDMESTA